MGSISSLKLAVLIPDISDMNSVSISAVDLFCGVGGLTHGLERAGVSVAAGVDIEAGCAFSFEANNSAKFVGADVATIASEEIESLFAQNARFRLLAGCAPCQPFSTYSQTGRGRKYEDQWPLLLKFGSLVRSIKPDFVTMENVPQLAQHEVFEQFLKSLKGYKVWWRVVDCWEYGVPQTRKRLVLLASRHGGGLELRPTHSVRVTVADAIAGMPVIAAGERDPGDPLHRSPRLSDINLRRIKASVPGGTWRDWPIDLQADCHRRGSGATYPSVYGRMQWGHPSPTMTTQCFGYGNGRFGHPEQDRAISLREAAMLQTFPRDYRFVSPGVPIRFSHLGRLIGNAVPVRLGEVIGEALLRHAATL